MRPVKRGERSTYELAWTKKFKDLLHRNDLSDKGVLEEFNNYCVAEERRVKAALEMERKNFHERNP